MQNGALQTFEAWTVPEVTPCYTMLHLTQFYKYINHTIYVFFLFNRPWVTSGVNMSGGGQHSRRGLVGTATWQKVVTRWLWNVVKCCVLHFAMAFSWFDMFGWLRVGWRRVTSTLPERNGVDCLLYVMRNARITDDAIAPCTARKGHINPLLIHSIHQHTLTHMTDHTATHLRVLNSMCCIPRLAWSTWQSTCGVMQLVTVLKSMSLE